MLFLLLNVPHGYAPTTPIAPGTVPTTPIAPGVNMPLVNFGLQMDHSKAIKLGVRGIDTALVYTDMQQREFANGSANCNYRRNATADIAHDFKVLGLDYVDLMLMHWPCDDPTETLAVYRAMESLVSEGKAKAVGVSNFNSSALATLLDSDLKVTPAVDQCAYSIAGHFEPRWGRDDASREACVAANCTFMAYSPLGGWALGGTGRVLNDPTVKSIGAAHNKSAAQVALRWVVQQGVVAVTSSDNAEYIAEDLDIFDFALSSAEMDALSKIR